MMEWVVVIARNATLFLGLAALLAACMTTTPPPTDDPRVGFQLDPCLPSSNGDPEGASGGETGEADPAGPAHLCAHVTFADRAERVLQVAVIAESAHDPFANRQLLVYHPGGPGISAVATMLADPPNIDLGRFTLLTWDGATASTTPGNCGGAEQRFATDRTVERLEELVPPAADQCFGGFGADSSFGAATAAAEVEAVRAAIGVDAFDLLAYSYGTAIAEVYLRQYPGHVRRAVLDGPVALEVPWASRLESVGESLGQLSNLLFESCGETNCSETLSTLAAQGGYRAIRDALMAQPPHVGTSDIVLTPTMLDQATLLALRSMDYWEPYLAAVDEALAGDGRGIWVMGERYVFGLDRVVYYASLCADLSLPTSIAVFAIRADPLLTTYATELALCPEFGFVRLEPEAPPRVEPAEVLLIASELDPLTPASLLDDAPSLAAVGPVCRTRVAGHTSASDPKVTQQAAAFLAREIDLATAAEC